MRARPATSRAEVPKMSCGTAGLWLYSRFIMIANIPKILANILDAPMPVCLWNRGG